MSSDKKTAFLRFLNRPLLPGFFRRRNKIDESETSAAVSSLALEQYDHCGFVSVFLLLLSVAYMVMYYGLNMHPDDLFYSLIAMYCLFGSSCLFGFLNLLTKNLHLRSPRLFRLASDAYFFCLLVVMGLYFYAASTNKNAPNNFSPSFLYLLIFAVLASPYSLDSLFFIIGGLVVDVVITIVGGMSLILVLQYCLIGLFLLAGTIYLSSNSFLAEVKTIRLNKANAELGFLSTHDQLTSINNRHSLHTYLLVSWPQFINEKTSVAFLLFDIDFFKLYNDKLSHIQGDECLKNVVNAVKEAALFSESCFYRFGGDEFLVVLPNVKEEEMKRIGVAMTKAIYDAQLPSAPGTPLPFVSVSCGGCLSPIEEGKNLDDYLSEADKELYLAKNDTRNCFFYQGKKVE